MNDEARDVIKAMNDILHEVDTIEQWGRCGRMERGHSLGVYGIDRSARDSAPRNRQATASAVAGGA